MRIGVLVTGDIAVRAAHALTAHPTVEDVVVVGPAKSKSFKVVASAKGCDLLIGTGPDAPSRARRHEVPLVWDGAQAEQGVQVWGAGPQGLTLALASRETDPRLIALAHPDLGDGKGQTARFPDPLGKLDVTDGVYAGHRLALARSPGEFAACLAIGANRRVTIIDDGRFLSGIALAAGVDVADGDPGPVWERALDYLRAVTDMGLVMAEDV